jgi:hypothetical protein
LQNEKKLVEFVSVADIAGRVEAGREAGKERERKR